MAQIADGSSEAEQNGKLADWIINKTGGKAKVGYITIPDLPIIEAGRNGFAKEMTAKCQACKLDKIEVTLDELGSGAIPSKVVAYLQTHPGTTDLVYPFYGSYIGSYPALKSAGNKARVSVIADGPLKEITSGKVTAGTIQGNQYLPWAAVDQMARIATGAYDPKQERKATQIPTWVIDSPQEAQKILDAGTTVWPGPAGFQEKFKQLWKVNG
jgi:ABC-type sugar transport system substrate-binding protein